MIIDPILAYELSQNHPSTLTGPILQVHLYPLKMTIMGLDSLLDSPSFQIGHTIPQYHPFTYGINTYATPFAFFTLSLFIYLA